MPFILAAAPTTANAAATFSNCTQGWRWPACCRAGGMLASLLLRGVGGWRSFSRCLVCTGRRCDLKGGKGLVFPGIFRTAAPVHFPNVENSMHFEFSDRIACAYTFSICTFPPPSMSEVTWEKTGKKVGLLATFCLSHLHAMCASTHGSCF